ncbi:cation diffusion facilitator family transporter [soil metagenome]
MPPARYARPDDRHDLEGRGTGLVALALVANVALAAGALAAFFITRSSSLLSRSAHAFADATSQVLLLLGGRREKQAVAHGHPFGYGRDRHFWGLVVSLGAFAAASVFAINRGITVIDRPEMIQDPEIALGVGGLALVVQLVVLQLTVARIRRAADDVRFTAYLRRAKHPQLPVAFLEGTAAVIATLVALGGVAATMATDDATWDGYASVAIGVVLAAMAVSVLIQMKTLLIGTSAAGKDVEAMRAAIEIEPEVLGVVHLSAEHLGPEELLLGAKVEVLHDLSVIEVAEVIDRVERNIRSNVPAARVIYLEPDVPEEHRATGAFVAEHAGHIDPSDPDYATITGQVPVVVLDDPDDDIWS